MVECTDRGEQKHADKPLPYFEQKDMAILKDLSSSLNENIVKYFRALLIRGMG